MQGDERDIVFISVGYGKQKSGALWLNFGPLNQDGGERRLNVLTTRARLRCEVFSNFTAEDLDLQRTGARGVVALKRYLQFAENGRLDLPQPSEQGPDSVFEEVVAEKVRGLGYEVHPQVGSGDFFIDLAVVDPKRPGRYLLGIECDGRTYHSASWARDRDRLRQQVLEGLGWSLHRIWSTDWFRNPDREVHKIADSLERAWARRRTTASTNAKQVMSETESGTTSRDEPYRRDESANRERHLTAEPYRCADLSELGQELKGRDLHTCSGEWLSRWVLEVVEIESPVHESEVARRIVNAAGSQRVGSRLEGAVTNAIDVAARRGELERSKGFVWAKGCTTPVPRDRSDQHLSIRQMDRIAPEEVEAAVLGVAEAATGISDEDAIVEVARLLGFARTGAAIRESIANAISRLKEQGSLRASGAEIQVVDQGR